MLKPLRVILVFTIAVALAACGGEIEEITPAARPVLVVKAEIGDVTEVFDALATARPIEEATLSSEGVGRLIFLVKEGADITKNQVIAQQEPSQIAASVAAVEAQYQNARATLDQAKRDAARMESLHAAGAVSRESLEKAKTAEFSALASVGAARAQVNEARSLLAKNTIRSPIGGQVLQTFTEIGEIISPGTPIARVGDISTLEIEAVVGERAAVRISPGTPALITFDALPGDTFVSTVSRVTGALAQDARTTTVTMSLANPSKRIPAGLVGRVILEGDHISGAVVVPRTAVDREPDGSFVWVVEDSQAKQVRVETGLEGQEYVAITSGLSEGEIVVLRGAETLIPGELVEIQFFESEE